MGSGEVAIVALSTMISLKVPFSDGLGGGCTCLRSALPLVRARSAPTEQERIACLGDLTTD